MLSPMMNLGAAGFLLGSDRHGSRNFRNVADEADFRPASIGSSKLINRLEHRLSAGLLLIVCALGMTDWRDLKHMQANYLALAIVVGYMASLGLLTTIVQRSVKTTRTFTSGTSGHSGVPAILVGLMLMSEFIGTSASVGTAQEAYKFGISASWNI